MLKINKINPVIPIFIVWRFILFLILLLGNLFLDYRTGQFFTNILNKLNTQSILQSDILYPWANFDGVHYLNIALSGYTTEAGFFPLYPLIIRFLNINNFNIENYFFTALILSNIFFLFGLIFFYKLLELDFSKKIVKSTIFYLLIFPTSFFFASIYSESLFFLLLMLSFYFARKEKWFYSVICAMFLSATRIVGILILPALIYEFYVTKQNNFKLNIKDVILFLLIPIGLFSYMIFNFIKWGDWFYFIKVQGMLSNNRNVDSIVLFPQTIFRYFKIIFTVSAQQFEWWVASLELLISLFAAASLFVAFKKRIRFSYIIFSFLALLLPISSGTLSGMPRYVLIVFPMYVVLALTENRIIKAVYSIVSIILLIMLLILFSKGYYVA